MRLDANDYLPFKPVRNHCVWGVDPSTKLTAVGMQSVSGGPVLTALLKLVSAGQEGERLRGFEDQIFSWARRLAATYPPVAIWVEQPSGRFVTPVLSYTVGVTLAALFDATGAPTWTCTSSSWKKSTVGSGGADKGAIAAWARSEGIHFSCQDEADAAGICLHGARLWAERTTVA